MQYGLINSIKDSSIECLVLGVFSDEINSYEELYGSPLKEAIQRFSKRLQENEDCIWHTELQNQLILLVPCGQKTQFNLKKLQKKLEEIISLLLRHHLKEATIALPLLDEKNAAWQLVQTLLQCDSLCYRLEDFKTVNKKTQHLTKIDFFLPGSTEVDLGKAEAIASGIQLTRRLADLPANHCTPSYLAAQATKLSKEHEAISCTLYDLAAIKELGMGALLAVAKGSQEPPYFIEMNYPGGAKGQAPIILVGKGITFDSGGLSIKPANAMDEMKYDMAGAAAVFGVLKACALLQLPINVIGLIASAENMPSGQAVKPGDIVTSLSGQSIEILNTDAEGRLVLADALTYAERFNPNYVIDIATLTGAMVVALGNITTGFMTNNDDLAEKITQAAAETADKAWRLPLDEDYQEALDSPLADMINASFDRSAGSITAACFLSRFSKNFPWAHLDIAGTAWISGKKRKATGRPVLLLTQLLEYEAKAR